MNSNGATLLKRYQRLIQISQDLASTLDLDSLLKRIVQAAADLSGAEAASILLYDDHSAQLHFEVATNLDEPMLRGLVVPIDNSIAGVIYTERKPMIIQETSQDPRHFEQIKELTNVSTRSMLGAPLIAKDKVIGVLEAINKRRGLFTEDDLNVMVALSAQAAIAIQNSRLFQQSDLISELVHELRTPLSSISTASHLLLKPEVSQEQRERMVEIIRDETFRLSEMTSSFLDLARLQSGRSQFHAETFDPIDLLEDSVEVMATRVGEKGLDLVVQIQDEMVPVKADRNKIKQVLLNLLSNAIKYNQPGGKICLHAQVVGEELVVSISDTGPGISPENIPNLFQKFYRVPGSEMIASGTGLGLSICKHIVEAHHGSIDVSSELGQGTTFTVHLPVGGF